MNHVDAEGGQDFPFGARRCRAEKLQRSQTHPTKGDSTRAVSGPTGTVRTLRTNKHTPDPTRLEGQKSLQSPEFKSVAGRLFLSGDPIDTPAIQVPERCDHLRPIALYKTTRYQDKIKRQSGPVTGTSDFENVELAILR